VGPILAPLFGNPSIVKVLHGGDTDIALLLSDLHVPLLNVFDTSQAFRALTRHLSSASTSHSPSFEYLANVFLLREIDKTLSRQEWKLRPLDDQLIEYARRDSHYLIYFFAIFEHLFDASKPFHFFPPLLEKPENADFVK
jgi:ribonuclease D